MARTAMSVEDKIKSALDKPLTETMEEFVEWLSGKVDFEVDPESVKVSQRLYPVYIKEPDVAEKIAARREANKEKKAAAEAARDEKTLERLSKLDPKVLAEKLRALGLEVTEAE